MVTMTTLSAGKFLRGFAQGRLLKDSILNDDCYL
jgi:hypothetical protein